MSADQRVVPDQRTGSGGRPGRVPINDVDLLEAVVRSAREPGYVLVGPGERVWLRSSTGRGRIERAASYEDAVVHQLLQQRLLRVGQTVTVWCGRHEGPGREVTVPASTVRTVRRWASYQRTAITAGDAR